MNRKELMRDRGLTRFLLRTSTNLSVGDEGKVIINFEEALFAMLEQDGKVNAGKLFKSFEEQGIRRDDPRLRTIIDTLSQMSLKMSVDSDLGEPVLIENLAIDKTSFIKIVKNNRMIFSKSFRAAFVLPEFRHFSATIKQFYNECKEIPTQNAVVYNRIPQTAKADPGAFGVAVCSIDGQRFSVGDTKTFFLLMSMSDALMYALARSELESEDIEKYIGQEPSGRDAKELALDSRNRPFNPLIDSGGIMIAALIQKLVHPDLKYSEVFDWVFNSFKRATGGMPFRFNNAAFIATKEAADGNYAQAYYMREMKCFPPGAELLACMDLYLQCHSMESTCETLAVIAATLANGGINPLTEEMVFKGDAVTDILSLMHSCGLKEYSGAFAFEVGMPAKSNACGALMVVVPNVLGYCVWSPPIDPMFQLSLRGLAFSEKIVSAFPFHHFDNVKQPCSKKTDPCRSLVDERAEPVVSLFFLAASGDAKAMHRFFMSGMDMSVADYDGRTALHLSAAEGHGECVEYLIKVCGADPNVVDRWGQTPLDDAILFGNTEVARILADAGGKPKATESEK